MRLYKPSQISLRPILPLPPLIRLRFPQQLVILRVLPGFMREIVDCAVAGCEDGDLFGGIGEVGEGGFESAGEGGVGVYEAGFGEDVGDYGTVFAGEVGVDRHFVFFCLFVGTGWMLLRVDC